MPYIAPTDFKHENNPKWGNVFKYIFSNGSSSLTIYKINTRRSNPDDGGTTNGVYLDQDANTAVIVGKKFYYLFPWDLCIKSTNRDHTLLFDKIVHTVSFGHGNNNSSTKLNPFIPPKGIKTINFCGPYGSTVTANPTNSCILMNKILGFWEYNQGKPRCGIYYYKSLSPLEAYSKDRVSNLSRQELISGVSEYPDMIMNINMTKVYNSGEYNKLISMSQCNKNVLFAFPRNRVLKSVTMKDMLFELVNIYTPNSITIISCRPDKDYLNLRSKDRRYDWLASNNIGPSISNKYEVSHPIEIKLAIRPDLTGVYIQYTDNDV
jgi:hypothetical protein